DKSTEVDCQHNGPYQGDRVCKPPQSSAGLSVGGQTTSPRRVRSESPTPLEPQACANRYSRSIREGDSHRSRWNSCACRSRDSTIAAATSDLSRATRSSANVRFVWNSSRAEPVPSDNPASSCCWEEDVIALPG